MERRDFLKSCGLVVGAGAAMGTPLLCVQADDRVDGLEDAVKVVLLRLQMPLQERLVMPADTLRAGFQAGDICIVPQEGFHLSTGHIVG